MDPYAIAALALVNSLSKPYIFYFVPPQSKSPFSEKGNKWLTNNTTIAGQSLESYIVIILWATDAIIYDHQPLHQAERSWVVI